MKTRLLTSLFVALVTLAGSIHGCPMIVSNDSSNPVDVKARGKGSMVTTLKPGQEFMIQVSGKDKTCFHVTSQGKTYDVAENRCQKEGNKLTVSEILSGNFKDAKNKGRFRVKEHVAGMGKHKGKKYHHHHHNKENELKIKPAKPTKEEKKGRKSKKDASSADKN